MPIFSEDYYLLSEGKELNKRPLILRFFDRVCTVMVLLFSTAIMNFSREEQGMLLAEFSLGDSRLGRGRQMRAARPQSGGSA